MRKGILQTLCILTLGILAASNTWAQVEIEGNGIIESESRVLSSVTVIKTQIALTQMEITESSTNYITTEGDSNILADLIIEESNDTLTIRFPEENTYINYTLNIDLNIENISSLISLGTGEIHINDFDNSQSLTINSLGTSNISIEEFSSLNDLELLLSGTGDVTFNQEINTVSDYTIINRGTGIYNGCKVRSNNCTVDCSGTGNCIIYATETLNATLNGTGNIIYYGSPQTINETNWGTGDISEGNDSDCLSTILSNTFELTDNISIYPNPSHGIAFITNSSTDIKGDIYDGSGRIVKSVVIPFGKSTLDLTDLPNSIYFLKFKSSVMKISKF